MKLVTIVGARPQFIKLSAVSRVLRKKHSEVLIHTGQHYDYNMSQAFFDEMEIPKPDYNLNIGSNTPGKQTAEMMTGIEEILSHTKPDLVLLYGDTNSTLAGALIASKMNLDIAHVEAGVRTYLTKNMPEEQNRLITDHLAKYNFCPSEIAVNNLFKENVQEHCYNVGDVMFDTLLYYKNKSDSLSKDYFLKRLEFIENKNFNLNKWYLCTIHRPENTDDVNSFKQILNALNELDAQVLFPVHPRTMKLFKNDFKMGDYNNIIFVRPLSYINTVFYLSNCIKVITDSGGLQKESYLLKKPGVVVLRNSPWNETLNGNINILAKPDKKDLLDKINNTSVNFSMWKQYYGDGKASEKIVDIFNEIERG